MTKTEKQYMLPPVKVAVLIDGSFFVKRFRTLYDKKRILSGADVATQLYTLSMKHVGKRNTLYRIFYYDCYPYDGKQQHPITGKTIDYKKTPEYLFRTELLKELTCKRKVALRMGTLKCHNSWMLSPNQMKLLLKGKVSIADLVEDDVQLCLQQKGIDMKIGVDIASLSLKKQVDRIVLIAGDSDFVPASKLARREGIDFVLDPMHAPIDPSLFEHIDGLEHCSKSIQRKSK